MADHYAGRESALVEAVAVLRRQTAGYALDGTRAAESRDWDGEAEAVRQRLAAAEERVAATKARVQERQQACAVAERLERLVALYLDPATSRDVLAERVAADASLLEKNKAFRMVREKVAASTPRVAEAPAAAVVVATPPRVTETLVRLREHLAADANLDAVQHDGLAVVACVSECARMVADMEDKQKSQVLQGVFLLLANRFGKEREIPLYSALFFNSLLLLERLDGGVSGDLFDEAAREELQKCLERVKQELRGHLDDASAFKADADEAESARRRAAAQTRGVKRCAHVVGLVRKAWSGVLQQETLRQCMGELANVVLERLIANVIELKDVSAMESEALASSMTESMDLLLPVLGLGRDSSETERRAAASSWPHARKLQELLAGSPLAGLESNVKALTSCFSTGQLRLLIEAIYEDNATRASVIKKL